jgi:hypothetical protein
MAYTNDQIKSYADSMLGSGKSWQDVWNTAQQHGVGLEQLTGAYGMNVQQGKQFAQQQGVNLWGKFDPNSIPLLENAGGGGERFDVANKRMYMPVYSEGRYEGQDNYIPGELTGYRGYDWDQGMYEDNHKMNGTQYDQYDATGNKTGTGTWTNLADDGQVWRDALKAAAVMAAVYTGGSMLEAAGGMGGGGAGYGITGGATEPIASIGATGGMTEAEIAALASGTSGATGTLGTLETINPATINSAADLTTMTVPGVTGVTAASVLGGASTLAKVLGIGTDAAKKLLGNMSLSDILGLVGGGLDYKNQRDSSKEMLDYLKGQQAKIDGLYAPGSNEYNALWSELSRKDAAAGRNSQAGPRSVDLAARIAQIKADQTTRMTTGIGALYKNSLDQKASAPTGLMSALDKISRSSGYSVSDIAKWFTDNGADLSDVYFPGGADFELDPDMWDVDGGV